MPELAITFPGNSPALRLSLAMVTEFSARSAVFTVKSVISADVIASSVAILPRPKVSRWAAALAPTRRARPDEVQTISSISPAPTLLRPSKRSVLVTS